MSAAPAAGVLALKVTVGDHWAPLHLDAAASDTVAALKGRALAVLHVDAARADGFEVKYGGARIADESASLGTLHIGTGAALVILSKRRRPVR